MLATIRCIDGHIDSCNPSQSAISSMLKLITCIYTRHSSRVLNRHIGTEVHGYDDSEGENLNEKVYLIFLYLTSNSFLLCNNRQPL